MDRLSVLCFAGTYGLALLSDLARFVLRAPGRWLATTVLLAVGWLVHTVYLVNLALREQHVRMATQFDFLVVLSWIFAAIALYLIVRVPKTTAIGMFVLPVALLLSALAGVSGTRPQAETWADWAPVWATIHGVFLSLGAVFISVAFAAGLMYLIQARRLKLKQPARPGFKLPSLEQSERLNGIGVTLAFPLLTFGLLVGVALNVERSWHEPNDRLSWTDPKILSAGITWLVFAVLLHARFRPEMRGRRVMLLSIVAFGFLLFTMFGVNLVLPTSHGQGLRSAQSKAATAAASTAAGVRGATP
jgi:ABC-type transport system involved in cytochrome c biogenesis permease subunit